MRQKETVYKALRGIVESHIYSRGLEYYASGLVLDWQAVPIEKNGRIHVAGSVEGGDIYDVLLEFDPALHLFTKTHCSCPYWDTCKHIVALGLVFIESIDERQTGNNIEKPRRALSRTVYRESAHRRTAQPARACMFDPRDYFIYMEQPHFVPKMYKRNGFSESANVKKLLERTDLSSAQRDLLILIANTRPKRRAASDHSRIFSLIAHSGIPLCSDRYGLSFNEKSIDLNPEPLRAELVYLPIQVRAYGHDRPLEDHRFFLRMPSRYWRGSSRWSGATFIPRGAVVVYDSVKTLALYHLTPLLAGVICRMRPAFDRETYREDTKHYCAELNGEEIVRYEELLCDARAYLNLLSPPPEFTVEKSTICQPSIIVDFDAQERTLAISPAIDYGFYRQRISENVRIATRSGRMEIVRHLPYGQHGSYSVAVQGTVIHCAKVDAAQEIAFFRECIRQAQPFGFSRTLKCEKSGNRSIAAYLKISWPALAAFASRKKYAVTFLKDSLSVKSETVRAEFKVDVNESDDLLSFDVACYCGAEKITLEKLLRYLSGEDLFLRKEDGTLIDIENRAELERLARLLKSFHASEKGFESKLYHASELQYVVTSSSHYNAVQAVSFKKFLYGMKRGKPVKPVRISRRLSPILRSYQRAGIEWLSFLRSYRFAGILADDMGLGKTVQALAGIAMSRGKYPSVIVCPKTLLYNWKAEVEKFTPELVSVVYEGSPSERKDLWQKIPASDLVIVSYPTLKADEAYFTARAQRFHYAILDEAQYIKNHASKNAQAVKKINADYRLALTGTPLENTVSELWSIFDFLMPGFLGPYEQFRQSYHKPIMEGGDADALEHLRRKVECFMLRRTKGEVLTELPPKIEQMSMCHLSSAQSVLYQQVLAKVRGDIFSVVDKKGFANSQIHILAGLMKLRQACNHPALLVKEKNWRMYESAKLDMCMEIIRETVEAGRKVLVFSQFTSMLDILSDALKERGVSHLYLSGATRDRAALIDRFNADANTSVFLISLKAGGVGLNLTAADTVIVFDPWWNPSVENQAVDRAHRIGQKKTVNVYRLLTTGTIEEKIQALKERKQRLFDAAVGESRDLFKKLTWDDVRELFTDAQSS